jgi:thiol-disulfide isomerase/thioredoxin
MTISDAKIISRQDLHDALTKNTGLLIIKLGAEWCGPCKKIESAVNFYMSHMPANATCVMVDIDESFDLYSFLKFKKVVNGIPSILMYEKGNTNFIPDEVHIGSDVAKVQMFFEKCKKLCD